jgi:hypothetical protein
MTVIATVLAGMSSGQMTQAQYHRSLAAQYQSKVGDQWNLFQAKRLRGTTLDMTGQSLRALADVGEVNETVVRDIFAQVAGDLERAEQEAGRLQEAVRAASAELKKDADPLQKKAEALGKKLKAGAENARRMRQKLVASLDNGTEPKPTGQPSGENPGPEEKVPEVTQSQAFVFLTTDQLPVADDEKVIDPKTGKEKVLSPAVAIKKDTEAINKKMADGIELVKKRATHRQMKQLIHDVSMDEVEQAIEKVQVRERVFDQVCRAPTNLGRKISDQLGRLLALTRSVDRDTRDFLAAVPAGNGEALTKVRESARELADTGDRARNSVLGVYNSFTVAVLGYDVRRYERQARYNQGLAELHELLAAESGITSDIHRARSSWLFYGMLAAQAGVTIATFSLAVRQRSALWTLATVAGMTALAVAGYGYQFGG